MAIQESHYDDTIVNFNSEETPGFIIISAEGDGYRSSIEVKIDDFIAVAEVLKKEKAAVLITE